MAFVADIRKSVTDTTPVYAAVGLTDLAVEKVRHASLRAAAVRGELEPTKLQTKAQARVAEVAETGKELPGLAFNRSLELAGKAQESYESVAARGERLVKRVRTQKSTKDLIAQAEATVALGKGAVTTVRHSASEIQRSAKATLTTGRREAARSAQSIAASAQHETAAASGEIKTSATRTRTAAKRTTTTTKNTAATTKAATKRATTSAKKTATASTKAATVAAEKVGD
jgi:hypothetical protein